MRGLGCCSLDRGQAGTGQRCSCSFLKSSSPSASPPLCPLLLSIFLLSILLLCLLYLFTCSLHDTRTRPAKGRNTPTQRQFSSSLGVPGYAVAAGVCVPTRGGAPLASASSAQPNPGWDCHCLSIRSAPGVLFLSMRLPDETDTLAEGDVIQAHHKHVSQTNGTCRRLDGGTSLCLLSCLR